MHNGSDHGNSSAAAGRGGPHFPKNDGPLPGSNGHARITGPCGETMEFWLVVRGGKIERASFLSDGCGSSHACASIAALLAETEEVDKATSLQQRDVLNFLGGTIPAESEHCALLAANTLRAACEDYLQSVSEHP